MQFSTKNRKIIPIWELAHPLGKIMNPPLHWMKEYKVRSEVGNRYLLKKKTKHWWIKGGARDARPPLVQFPFIFSNKSRQIIAFSLKLKGLPLFPEKSYIRQCSGFILVFALRTNGPKQICFTKVATLPVTISEKHVRSSCLKLESRNLVYCNDLSFHKLKVSF